MRSRILFGAALLIAILAVVTLAASDVGAIRSRQWTMVNFIRPTVVAGSVLQGPVLIVHDSALMERGEPCTTVYRFNTSRGPQEKIVSFMCKPTIRDTVSKFTFTCSRAQLTGPDVLTEYQFAGEKEAHGVPSSNR